MIAKRKFDEIDRRFVIEVVSRSFDVRLSRFGGRRKWLKDEQGRSFWILGGFGKWHGIPEAMMDAEAADPTRGIIVIALRMNSEMRVYTAPLSPFVESRSKFSRAEQQDGDLQYEFNCQTRGRQLVIKDAPAIVLSELEAVPYGEHEREQLRYKIDAENSLNSLSVEDRKLVLSELLSESRQVE